MESRSTLSFRSEFWALLECPHKINISVYSAVNTPEFSEVCTEIPEALGCGPRRHHRTCGSLYQRTYRISFDIHSKTGFCHLWKRQWGLAWTLGGGCRLASSYVMWVPSTRPLFILYTGFAHERLDFWQYIFNSQQISCLSVIIVSSRTTSISTNARLISALAISEPTPLLNNMSNILGGVTDTVGKTAGGVTNTAADAGRSIATCLHISTNQPLLMNALLVGGVGSTLGDTTKGVTDTAGGAAKGAGGAVSDTTSGVTDTVGGATGSGGGKESAQNPLGL